MKLRVTIAAILCAVLAAPVVAAARFPDVPDSNPHSADIQWVSDGSRKYFGGYPDGSFKPDRVITPEQMAKVLDRLPGDMTRAEFASFLVGGLQRMRDKQNAEPTTTTTTAPPQESMAWAGTCAGLYDYINNTSLGWDYNWRPDQYTYNRDSVRGESYLDWGRYDTLMDIDILRVTDWYERFRTNTTFLCQGNAKLRTGNKLPMVIAAIIDQDGDDFYHYWFPAGDQPTCQEAKRSELSVWSYNIGWLYGSARDADGDKIMCENILREDNLQVVGNPIGPGV